MSSHPFEKQSDFLRQFSKATDVSQNENGQFAKKTVLTAVLTQVADCAKARDAAAAASLLSANSAAFPEQFWHPLFRAEALFSKKDFEQAAALIDSIKNVLNEKSEADLSIASLVEQAERLEKSFRAVAENLLFNPDDEAALEQAWLCAEMNGCYEDSLNLHKKIVDLRPYSHRAWFNLGHAHLNLGDEESALEAFEFSYLAERKFELAWQAFGKLAFERGEFERALRCFKEMMAEIGSTSECFVRIGECHEKMGRRLLAMSFFREAIDKTPENSEAFYRLGLALGAEDRWREAAAALEQAIQLENRQDEYQAALAAIYLRLGDTKRAAQKMQRAIFLAPEITAHWLQYARFLIGKGKLEKALDLLNDAEENAFLDAELLYCRTACLFLMADRDGAFETLDAALAEDFSMHKTLFDHAPSLREDVGLQAHIAAFLSE